MTEWKIIPNFPNYEISDDGRVRNISRSPAREIRPSLAGAGYLVVFLPPKGSKIKYIHRLIAEAFVPNPKGKIEVNHIDGDKLNNAPSNLEWVTRSENNLHKTRVLQKMTGENHPFAKLTDADVADILVSKLKTAEIAVRYGVSHGCIYSIRQRRNWRHITGGQEPSTEMTP